MKSILKAIFSRFFIIALTIILLFASVTLLVLGTLFVLERILLSMTETSEVASYWIGFAFAALNWFVVAITMLHIANRDMIPETKLPWALCVALLNLFGVAIYIVFSNHRPSRKQLRKYDALNEISRSYIGRNIPEEEKDAMGNWAQVSEALRFNNHNAVLRGGTATEYFPQGEDFMERFIVDLRAAKKFIFLEYFILARGKMWDAVLTVLEEKVREGVEVRVMYDDIGCMGKLRAGYYKLLRKKGIKCVKFNPFVPVVSNIHNNRDHRKITVIDGYIGYTGGLNFADEYINETSPFGKWKDSAIRLEGEGVKDLTLMFLRIYNLYEKEPEDFSPYIPERFEPFEGEGFVQAYGDGPKPIYRGQIAESLYIDILNTARKYVYIMTPYLIIDHRMRSALLAAAARGADVRIIVPHTPDKKIAFALTRSNYMALIRGGVKIYEYLPGFIHSKCFLADDCAGVVGTINLDYRSLLHHFENAVLMFGTTANEQLKEDFEKTFGECALQTEEDAKRRVVSRLMCELAKVFAPMF